MNSTLQTGSFSSSKAQLGLNGKVGKLRYLFSVENNRSGGLSDALDTLGNQDFNRDGFNSNAIMAKLDYRFNKYLNVTPLFRFASYENTYDEGAFTDGDNQFDASFINMGLNAVYAKEKIYAKLSWNQNLTDRLFNTAFGEFDYLGNNNNVEGFMNWKFNDNVNLTAGLFFTHQSTSRESQVEDWITSTWAPYTNLSITKNRFQLEMSFRYNDHSTYGSNSNYSIIPAFYITPSSRIFISYNTGFKAPISAQLFGPFGANPDLLPQTSSNFEVGYDQAISNELVEISVNYFRREINDIIIFTNQYENRDLQKDQGLEIESRIKLNDAFRLFLAYTYVDGFSVDNSGPSEERIDNLYRRAKHNLNGRVSYNINKKLSTNLNFIYAGKRDDIYFDLSSFGSKIVELDPYVLINASASYQVLKRFQLFARLNNLTNTDYTEIYGYSTPGINGLVGINIGL